MSSSQEDYQLIPPSPDQIHPFNHNGGPSMDHDGGLSLDHNGGPFLDSDGGPSLDQNGGPSLDHDGGPSLDHNGGPFLHHDGGPSLDHNGGPFLDSDGGPSLDQNGGPSLDHDGGPSLDHNGGPFLHHDGGPSLDHDGGPQSPYLDRKTTRWCLSFTIKCWKEFPGAHVHRSCYLWRTGISAEDKEPKPGDFIEIFRGLYQHWAIYVGDGNVIHVVPPSEHADAGVSRVKSVRHDEATVMKEKLQKVVGSDEYRIHNLLDEQHEPRPIQDILWDAESLVGETLPYSVFTNNCEHFVTLMRYGKPQSQQVQKAVAVVGGILFLFFLVSKFKRQSKAETMNSEIYYSTKYSIKYFIIRQNIQPAVYDPAVLLIYSGVFSLFTPISTAFLPNTVNQLKPTGLPSDVISPLLRKQVFDVVDPTLLNLINMNIEPGDTPNYLNHVRLKRPHLDPSVLLNFRSSNNLSFSYKILEKAVFHQRLLFESKILNTKLDFRKSHSTEKAYLKYSNDVLLTTDSVGLVPLDLSAAFDMVDHNLLSYTSDSSFSGNITPFHSDSVSLTCGITQGSALAPILLPLKIIKLNDYIGNHYYVDGKQIYLNLKQILPMVPCLKYIKAYIHLNFLSLNKRDGFMHSDAQRIPNLNSRGSTLLDNSLKYRRQLDQAVKFKNCQFKASLYLQNNNFPKARPQTPVQTPVPKSLRGPLVRNRYGQGLTILSTCFLLMKNKLTLQH